MSKADFANSRIIAPKAPPRPLAFNVYWHEVLLVILFVALFHFNLQRLWERTNPFTGDPNWGHTIFLPLIGLAYLYLHREELGRIPRAPSPTGALILPAGLILFIYGLCMYRTYPGLSDWVQDLGMVISLLGVVCATFGWQVMTLAWFPIAYLLLAMPWPPTLQDEVTGPLQHLAASASVLILQCFGLNIEQAGNQLVILGAEGPVRVLNVAEACSGLRSVVTFLAIGAAVAFLPKRPSWGRAILVFSSVLIAVACNVIRIVGQGLLDQFVSTKLSQGFYHEFVGLVMVAAGLLMLLGVGWLVDHLLIVEPAFPVSAIPTRPRRSDSSTFVKPSTRWVYPVVVAILLTSAVGINAAAQAMQLHFQKVSVPLRQSLASIPEQIGSWRQVSIDQPLDADTQERLGTTAYVFRDYVDTRLVDDGTISSILKSPPDQRERAITDLQTRHPEACITLAVTFYTGRIDSVAHYPERCYLGGGYSDPVSNEFDEWNVNDHQIPLRRVRFEASNGVDTWARDIADIYQVNGHFESERWRVRSSLMNIFQKASYYAKIEITTCLIDQVRSQQLMVDFMSDALPRVGQCLPPLEGADQ